MGENAHRHRSGEHFPYYRMMHDNSSSGGSQRMVFQAAYYAVMVTASMQLVFNKGRILSLVHYRTAICFIYALVSCHYLLYYKVLRHRNDHITAMQVVVVEKAVVAIRIPSVIGAVTAARPKVGVPRIRLPYS